jgi:hypothetical protein
VVPTTSATAPAKRPDPGVQVERHLAGLRGDAGQHGVDQRLGRAGMHLPEPAHAHPPVAPRRVLADPGAPTHLAQALSTRDQRRQPLQRRRLPDDRRIGRRHHHGPVAAGGDDRLHRLGARPRRPRHTEPVDGRIGDPAALDRHHGVRAVLAQAEPVLAVDREAHPGTPAEPVDVTGHRLHDRVDGQPGQVRELLPDHRRLELPLQRQRRVLPVAATAPARPGVGAGRLDAPGRRLVHLDGVRA